MKVYITLSATNNRKIDRLKLQNQISEFAVIWKLPSFILLVRCE